MDAKLKIRQAKRSKDKTLDLSNMELREIPIDIQQLTMLESLNVSNNKLTSLKRVEDLPNLREIIASNNQISALHNELQDMYCLDTLILIGNPVVNQHPEIAKIEGDEAGLQAALDQYFSGAPRNQSSAFAAETGSSFKVQNSQPGSGAPNNTEKQNIGIVMQGGISSNLQSNQAKTKPTQPIQPMPSHKPSQTAYGGFGLSKADMTKADKEMASAAFERQPTQNQQQTQAQQKALPKFSFMKSGGNPTLA